MLARGKVTEENLYDKFRELIEKTAFGKRSDSEISADLYRYGRNNQANWRKRVSDVVTSISEFLTSEAGMTMDSATARTMAIELIYAGEDEDAMAIARRVRAWIKDNRTEPEDPGNGDTPGGDDTDTGKDDDDTDNPFVPGGERAKYRNQLAAWFSANGLIVSATRLDEYVDDIMTGASDVDQVKQWFRDNRLAVTYSGYADEFKRGMDASDIALDFRATMAGLLERNVEDIDFSDPLVQKAMQRRNESGQPAPMTRYEFEQEVRSSADWQKTTNAMSVYTDIGEGILRSFGFRG